MKLDQIYIYLPKKFWKQHDQCERLVMQIEEFLTDSSYDELRIQKINFSMEPMIYKDENILDFLLRINMIKEYDRLVRNTLINALIGDACYFMQEAISCSKKKRLSVMFALLRKPFIDHLLVFLRIMFEDDFLDKFNSLDSFDSTSIKEPQKRSLLRQSLPLLIAAKSFTEDELYDYIFNQEKKDSFINLSNKALHLSTTRNRNNETGIQNLNFIFANQKDIENLWGFIYKRLPALLLYYVELIEALVFISIDLPKEKLMQRIKERLEILSR